MEPKAYLTALVLATLWIAEGFIPYYAEFPGELRRRLQHDARNAFVGLFNAILMILCFSGVLAFIENWSRTQGIGLLRLFSWPTALETVLAILLFDFWMYLWHRANHVVPFLWRFHRMHHSDPRMDASTALRFHPGEVALSALARMLVLPLFGISLPQLALYEAILLPVILLHHSNVRLPRWLDHGLLALIVTPAMHRVHHSRWRPETDSNYSSVFPYWDWIFRTFRLRADTHAINLGLDEFDGQEWQGLPGLLKTPLRKTHRETKDDEPTAESEGDRDRS